MALKKWVVNTPDKELAKSLAGECDIDPFIAMLAVSRGVTDASELEQLISDEPLYSDPYELADITAAAEKINAAIAEDLLIAVFGDYDCDGVTATALMYDYLSSRGARVVPYIPDRIGEGYGMNRDAVDALNAKGVGLIITVDNGISCADEIAYAAELGIETVVTDHHIPPEKLPVAAAVVDPHRADCPSSFKEICGAMVAFFVVCVTDDKEPEQLIPRYADLLAIAAIGDVMPLVYDNRSVVRAGVRMMNRSPRTGIAALISVAGINRGELTSGRVAYGIVPRMNAAGRMGSAERAFRLLISDNMMEALQIANEIDNDNSERQQIEQQILAAACAQIEELSLERDRVLVVAGENWHPGVIGIVASRLVDRFAKPAIVITVSGDTAHGSGRSYEGFSLFRAIDSCAEHLLKYGGHELAAGISLQPSAIGAFREEINRYALGQPYCPQELRLDFRLNPAALSLEMAESLRTLEPFGTGNPTPQFGLFGVQLAGVSALSGGKHQRLNFTKNGASFQAMLFSVSSDQFCFEVGDVLDLAVTLETNVYQGVSRLSVHIRAMRMAGINDNDLAGQLGAYENYLCGCMPERGLLCPTREEIGEIYKRVARTPVSAERIKHLFLQKPGYGKTKIAVDVLKELGLITTGNGMISAVPDAGKRNLTDSALYRTMLGKEEAS